MDINAVSSNFFSRVGGPSQVQVHKSTCISGEITRDIGPADTDANGRYSALYCVWIELKLLTHDANIIPHNDRVLDLLEIFVSTPALLLRPEQMAVLNCFCPPYLLTPVF